MCHKYNKHIFCLKIYNIDELINQLCNLEFQLNSQEKKFVKYQLVFNYYIFRYDNFQNAT